MQVSLWVILNNGVFYKGYVNKTDADAALLELGIGYEIVESEIDDSLLSYPSWEVCGCGMPSLLREREA